MQYSPKPKVGIPPELIPLVALHWGYRWWYGSGMTVLDMRRFFEPLLRNAREEEEVIQAWVSAAEGWATNCQEPGRLEQMLEEYHSIRVVA